MTKEQAINILIKNDCNTNLISDGYHTFGELYDHRIALWIALLRTLSMTRSKSSYHVWMADRHHDNSVIDGWFILGLTFDRKQVTYHLPVDKWRECLGFADLLHRAPEWDGHTSQDVLARLPLI